MLEENRLKALKEIRDKLKEKEKVQNIVERLYDLLEKHLYDEYIDLLIKEQPLLIKYQDKSTTEHISGLYGPNRISLPNDSDIFEKTFEKYADDNNPIFFYPHAMYIKDTCRKTIGYKNLENGEELTDYEYQKSYHFKPKTRIELENPAANYFVYRSCYLKLLTQHTVEEAYEILNKLAECENQYYRAKKL